MKNDAEVEAPGRTPAGMRATSLTYRQSDGRVDQQWYAPWGTVRQRTGVLPTDYTFTGQRDVEELGLLWYNSRFYDPYLSLFIQPDTLIPDQKNPLDWNRFLYTRANPVLFTDPSGHMVACDKDDWACQTHWDDPVVEEEPYIPSPLDPVIELVLTTVWEPLDWMTMADSCMHGECSPWFVLALAPLIAGSVGDDIGEGLIRLVRNDQIGTSQPFKLRKGEDGLSVFEGVSPEDVLDVFPGNEVPNTTVIITKDSLPPGTQVISIPAPDLPQLLSEAHRILVRPEGW